MAVFNVNNVRNLIELKIQKKFEQYKNDVSSVLSANMWPKVVPLDTINMQIKRDGASTDPTDQIQMIPLRYVENYSIKIEHAISQLTENKGNAAFGRVF